MSSEIQSAFKTVDEFYQNCEDHWSKVPPTLNGVLDGCSHISCIDISGSEEFLEKIYKTGNHPGRSRALDCGAGIGRVTNYLLSKYFEKVDLLEQNPRFIEEAKNLLRSKSNVDKFFCVGLQNFVPECDGPKYDVIWCQWILQNLVDEDVLKFFEKCKKILNNRGIIVIKENVTSTDSDDLDANDSSIIRTCKSFHNLLKIAKFRCIRTKVQRKFPKELYAVHMFAAEPII